MNVTEISAAHNITAKYEANKIKFTERLDWILPVLNNIVLIFATLWMFMSLIDYGIKTRKWKQSSSATFDKLNAGIVYSFVVVCSVFCFLFFVSDLIFMSAADSGLCEAAADVSTILYAMILWSVFLFLWFRQKAFYTNSAFTSRTRKGVKFVSLSSIALISVSGLGYVLLFTIPDNYIATSEGCVLNFTNGSLQATYGIYVVLFIFLSHVMLLCLFIYPLLKQRKGQRCKPINKFNPETVKTVLPSPIIPRKAISRNGVYSRNSLSVKPSRKRIRLLLRKTLLFALLSTITDVGNQVICFYFKTTHRRFHSLMFDFAAFFNLLFLILSFATYKNILKSLVSKQSPI